jgi:hypothetical protein
LLLSPQFTFLIGKEKKTIVVHANAIAATCDQMNALINGNMNEANTRCAEIGNIEVEDFIRFCEYAYRGDFTVPSWEQDDTPKTEEDVSVPPNIPEAEVEELPPEVPASPRDVPWSPSEDVPQSPPEDVPPRVNRRWRQSVTPPNKEKSMKVKLREKFDNHIYGVDVDDPIEKILAQYTPYANDTVNQDFTPVFLAYARLYTFAHFRSIEPLKALTLRKLHSTLQGFKPYRARVGDVVKLAEYAYTADDLPSRGENGTIDPLRELVVEYIACEIEAIGDCSEFKELLEEGGEFVGDFWETTRKYLM